jgi:hypothetical protein
MNAADLDLVFAHHGLELAAVSYANLRHARSESPQAFLQDE